MVAGNTPGGGYTDRMDRYDAQSDSWSEVPSLAFPGGARGYGVGETLQGTAYFGFGLGKLSNGYLYATKDLWAFNGSAWARLADCDCRPRYHPAMVGHGELLYVGTGGSFAGDLADFWSYSPRTNSWTELAPLNGPPRHHPFQFTATDADGVNLPFVLFGHGNGIYRTSHAFAPLRNEWRNAAPLPAQGRVAGTQFSYGGAGYALSGEGEDHLSMATGEFWKLELGNWSQLPSHPGRSRWAPASFVLRGHVHVLGGVVYQRNVATSWQIEAYRFRID